MKNYVEQLKNERKKTIKHRKRLSEGIHEKKKEETLKLPEFCQG